jgi:hypothetical protein
MVANRLLLPTSALYFCLLPVLCHRVWVYTLVNTDYDGNKLLPHFFNYYHGQGITWRRFLVLLHHTPGKYSRKGLEDAMGICSGYAVECRCGLLCGCCACLSCKAAGGCGSMYAFRLPDYLPL